MYRYSTPTIPIKMIDLDFSEVAFFRIKIENDKTSILQQIAINDARVDAENKTIYFTLTQEETAEFQEGFAAIQVRVKFNNGNVEPTPIKQIQVKDVLDEVVI